jgi:hypothetical protein
LVTRVLSPACFITRNALKKKLEKNEQKVIFLLVFARFLVIFRVFFAFFRILKKAFSKGAFFWRLFYKIVPFLQILAIFGDFDFLLFYDHITFENNRVV